MSLVRDVLNAVGRAKIDELSQRHRPKSNRVMRTGTNRTHNAAWTPEQEAIMLRCMREGLSQAQAGERIGKTANAVGCKLARMGLSGLKDGSKYVRGPVAK